MFSRRLVISFFASLSLSSLFVSPLFAEDAAAPKPIITVSEAFHSFGTVGQGTVIKHDFVIKNSGTADLVIQRLIAACGCTAALPPTGPILPGQTAPVSVTFDSAGFEGNVEKTVRVFSNDTESPAPLLTLKGSVETPLVIDPVRINFGDVAKGSAVTPQPFKVTLKPEIKGVIRSITTFSKDLSITSKQIDARTTAGEVTLREDIKSGDFRDRLMVNYEDSNGRQQVFNIPVVAMVRGSVEVLPKSLSVGVIEGKNLIVRSARLVNRSKTPLEVVSVSSDSAAVSAVATKIREGKEYNIAVTVDPAKVNADIRASVRIETNNKEQGSVILNVYGILPPKR